MTTTAAERLWFLDTAVAVRVSARDGSDGVSIVESFAPFADSPPLHVHHTEDEIFHVLEGELRLVVGDDEVRAGAGEILLAPKGVPHTYVVTSEGGASWLVTTANGDFENFLRAVARPAEHDGLPAPAGKPTPEAVEALAEIGARYGIELVGPPLAP